MSYSEPDSYTAAITRPAESNAVSIQVCHDDMRDDWGRFMTAAGGASFYHLWDWRRVNAGCLGHQSRYLAALQPDGSIAGILPLTLVESRLFGRILCSMPFVNFGGPCADSEAIALALARAAMAQADELEVDYLELRCTNALDLGLPVSLRKISMTVDLSPDPDALWNGFTSKHRKNVKRAYKNGLDVKTGGADLLPVFYRLMEESWRNLGTPLYARDYFENILATFRDDTRVFVCQRAGEPVAVAMTGYCNGVVEGLWAGGGAAARQLDANYVLYWEMIRDACTRGFRHFHLGRSTADAGGEEFKRKWNARAQQLYWYYYLPGGGAMPALNVDNPKYRLAIKAWRRLPLWTTRLLGPHLAKLVP